MGLSACLADAPRDDDDWLFPSDLAAPPVGLKGPDARQTASAAPPPPGAADRPVAPSYVARIKSGASCPTPPKNTPWILEPIASGSTLFYQRLERYCVYSRLPGFKPSALDPTTLSNPSTIETLGADYVELLPQSDTESPFTEPTQTQQIEPEPVAPEQTHPGSDPSPAPMTRHEFFVQQQGAVFSPDALSQLDDTLRPYIGIIDTADPNKPFVLDPNQRELREHHGLAMAGIVNTLRCPDQDPTCEQRLFFQQAFPYHSTAAPGTGAHESKGSVRSLMEAVIEAVESWKTQTSGSSPVPPLILNLSVGWAWSLLDTEQLHMHGASLLGPNNVPTTLAPAEEALFITLAWASCHGVLLIAAAGNTQGGACNETGPMAPGAWEAIAAPSAAQCLSAFNISSPDPDHALGSLVYAAGGIDAGHRPIVNSRVNSTPARVLYSSMSPSQVQTTQTLPITGTSVATASLSAIAAQVWNVEPHRSSREVMERIDDPGSSVSVIHPGWTADLYHPENSAPPVKRIRANVVLPGLYLPNQAPHTFPSSMGGNAGQFTAHSAVALSPASMPAPSCTDRMVVEYSFPDQPTPSTTMWPELRPQPDRAICPTCPLNIDGLFTGLHVDIDASHSVTTAMAILEVQATPTNQTTQITRVPLDLEDCMTPSSPQVTSCTVELEHYVITDDHGSQLLVDFLEESSIHAASVFFYVDGHAGPQLRGNEIPVVR